MRRFVFLVVATSVASLAGGCSATKTPSASGNAGGGDSNGASSSATNASAPASASSGLMLGTDGGTGSGGATCSSTPNEDSDKDGWTSADGDCNDCDPNVNPGAINLGNGEDCSGTKTKPAPCDSGLALDDVNAADAAKAIELCQTTTASATGPMKKWGVLDAQYVRANGDAYSKPGPQVGLLSGFGPNVHVQAGSNMLVLSAGTARTPDQPDACGSNSCPTQAGTAPDGFPQNVPGCTPDTNINDDVGLEVQIRSPTNATGYTYNFKFYSFEFPYYVCSDYNDQFIALANPAPAGAINGNISFDSKSNPVSVNLAFFDVCDPKGQGDFAKRCNTQGGPCPAAPNPYCPSGITELMGTGFDIWGNNEPAYAGGGATSWLQTQAPLKGGDSLTLRFAIWNTGDQSLFSTVLLDNFAWIATGGSVTIGTTPTPMPK